MEVFFTSEGLLALVTLTLLEVVLGIDNIIFISIVAGHLPPSMQKRARTIGLFLAMFARLLLLVFIKWIMGLHADLFTVLGQPFNGRDLILLGGGLFLIVKTIMEILEKFHEASKPKGTKKAYASFSAIIFQIILIDLVFSFDSILTAVGLVEEISIMMAAVIISVLIMLLFSGPIAEFVNKRPTVKMLALSFLVIIGGLLVAEGLRMHVDKGYIYFAMAFSLAVDFLNRKMMKAAAAKN